MSVFSFLRTLTTRHCSQLLPPNAVLLRRPAAAAIDGYLLPAGPAAANPPQRRAAVDRCDRQWDGHLPRAVSIMGLLQLRFEHDTTSYEELCAFEQ